MKKVLLSAATIASLFAATADMTYIQGLEQFLTNKTLPVNGKFYTYDFNQDGRINYNDWIYVSTNTGNAYRLLAQTPNDTNAFGFAPVALPANLSQPKGYFINLNFPQDQDPKFSWLYVSSDGAIYKLMGATPDGKFDYLDINGDGRPDPLPHLQYTLQTDANLPGVTSELTITITSTITITNGAQGGINNQLLAQNLITTTPATELTRDQINEVFYMWNEEKLAHDLYLNLYNLYSSEVGATPLYNIATRSETLHMDAVERLIDKYELNQIDAEEYGLTLPVAQWSELPSGKFAEPNIQALYDDLYAKGTASLKDALEVGCIVEVTDVEDLDQALEIAQGNEDLTNVFTFLRQGSYNHYWAFDRALKIIGVSEGCCSLGERYCKTPQEYPANNGAQQISQGNGNGFRGGKN